MINKIVDIQELIGETMKTVTMDRYHSSMDLIAESGRMFRMRCNMFPYVTNTLILGSPMTLSFGEDFIDEGSKILGVYERRSYEEQIDPITKVMHSRAYTDFFFNLEKTGKHHVSWEGFKDHDAPIEWDRMFKEEPSLHTSLYELFPEEE